MAKRFLGRMSRFPMVGMDGIKNCHRTSMDALHADRVKRFKCVKDKFWGQNRD